MRNALVIFGTIMLLGFVPQLHAQFGGGLAYQSLQADDWEAHFETNDSASLATDAFRLSAYYWFRPKNLRIEFLPEISFRSTFAPESTPLQGEMSSIGFQVNTDFYILDLLNDCNCPTFSKDGGILKKGFFIELAPGIDYHFQKLSSSRGSESAGTLKSQHLAFKLAFGGGIDIGISELLTLTPFLRATWLPSNNWDGLADFLNRPEINEDSSMFLMGGGIRLSFRPDYLRR